MSADKQRFSPLPSSMSEDDFVARYGGIYEHSPWIATACWRGGLDETRDTVAGLAGALAAIVDDANPERRRNLINAHPDLAGRAAIAGELTAESTAEQASAGIEQCSAEEFREFQLLNERYKDQFGITFVMAVKGSDRFSILEAFRRRLLNDRSTEFDCAIAEIHKIARLRLTDMANKDSAVATGEAGDVN